MQILKLLKFKLFIKDLPIYALVVTSLSIISVLTNKCVEVVFFVMAFILLRYKFSKTYHEKSAVKCCIVSILFYSIGALLTTPTRISVLSAVVVALLGTYVAFVVRDYKDSKNLTIEEMTDEQFIKYCQHHNLADDEIKIADLFLRQKLKGEEFYNAIGYSPAQAKRKRKQIKDKLHI